MDVPHTSYHQAVPIASYLLCGTMFWGEILHHQQVQHDIYQLNLEPQALEHYYTALSTRALKARHADD